MHDKTVYPSVNTFIRRVFDQRRVRKSALSRVLGVGPSTVTDLMTTRSMGTERLWNLCVALRHNFFADIAAQLPSDFATNAPRDTTALDRMSELEKEVEQLKMEIAVWEKLGRREF